MRPVIKACLVALGLILPTSVQAACEDPSFGHSRTIKLHPKDHGTLLGHEKKLGLARKEVVLTFDDGPLPEYTSKVLDALEAHCAKATFFVVGRMAKAYPTTLKKVAHQGHTIAHHTHRHDRLTNFSVERASKLIDQGVRQVEKVIHGHSLLKPRVPFFRYPYLARTNQTDRMLREKGFIAFGANIDSRDWEPSKPQALRQSIMRKLRREGRGILLMHDIQARTAAMLPNLLNDMKAEGFKIVHLVADPKAVPRPGFKPVPEQNIVIAETKPDLVKQTNQLATVTTPVGVRTEPTKPEKTVTVEKPKTAERVIGKVPAKPDQTIKIAEPVLEKVKVAAARAAFSPARKHRKANRARKFAVTSRGWKLRSSQWIIR